MNIRNALLTLLTTGLITTHVLASPIEDPCAYDCDETTETSISQTVSELRQFIKILNFLVIKDSIVEAALQKLFQETCDYDIPLDTDFIYKARCHAELLGAELEHWIDTYEGSLDQITDDEWVEFYYKQTYEPGLIFAMRETDIFICAHKAAHKQFIAVIVAVLQNNTVFEKLKHRIALSNEATPIGRLLEASLWLSESEECPAVFSRLVNVLAAYRDAYKAVVLKKTAVFARALTTGK